VSTIFGQAITGSLVGNVADAKVTITETNTGITRTATTNTEGSYVVPYLPPGRYKIEVEKQGLKKFARDGVVLATEVPSWFSRHPAYERGGIRPARSGGSTRRRLSNP
jgi:hypothetical protein